MNKNKQKLMIIVPTLHQGGQERVVVRTSRLLEPYFDITIVIFDGSDIGYDVSELNIINIDIPAKPGRVNKIINVLKRRSKLRSLKKEYKPDIAYSYGPSANLVNALSRVDTYVCEDNVKPRTWVSLRNYIDAAEHAKMRLFIKKSDLIVCCARDIETYVKRTFGNVKVTTLYNLYDIPQIIADSKSAEPDDEWLARMTPECRHIMSMGRDDDQKMFWHMLRAFKVVNDNIPEARLTILGAGTWEMYKNMAEELGISDVVYFAGQQANPYRFLKYGEIGWMTSRNEGFPNALVEGMALGLATVSTNCLTGPAEILMGDGDGCDTFSCEEKLKQSSALYGEYGIITPELDRNRNLDTTEIPKEDNELAKVMINFLNDKEMIKKYQKAATDRAQKYTYESYLNSFLILAENK